MTTTQPVRILRVLGVRSKTSPSNALIVAVVDDHLVKFSRRDGWTCDCDTDEDWCPHVNQIDSLLDDRVLDEEQR